GQMGPNTSSLRFKANIRSLTPKSISGLGKLRPVSFNYRADSRCSLHWGFIAEEVEKAIPHLVRHDAEGMEAGIDSLQLLAALVLDLQTKYQRVEVVERELARLQAV